MENVLLYFVLKYNGHWESVYNALERKETIEITDLQNAISQTKEKPISIINPLYPANLKNIYKPPFVIFVKGNVELLEKFNNSLYIMFAEQKNKEQDKLLKDLNKQNKIIIINSNRVVPNALKEILSINTAIKLIIIANDYIQNYIDKNRDLFDYIEPNNFLIVSYLDQNDNTQLFENNQMAQNELEKITLGLSKAAIVMKNQKTNENLNVVNNFVNEGKDIFVFPEMPLSKFKINNYLIKNGAILIESLEDISKN